MAEAQLSSIKCTNFSDVLENAVQEAHGGLLDLAQRLPALSDEDRKRELLQHLQTTRQRLQRLHVCAQWAHKAKAVNACKEVLKAAADHGAAFMHAADEFFRLHEELRFARAPLFDVSTALHILQSGTYRLLPAVIEDELQQPGQRLERPGELDEAARVEKRRAALRRLDFLLRSKLLASDLPAGLRVVRVRGGQASVAAAGGQYTAQLTLVPSPRDEATLLKYRPPGEPEEAAAPKEEPEVTQPAAGAAAAAAEQPSTSAATAPATAPGAAQQREGTDCWRWQLLSFELLPAAARHDPPPLLPAQRQWLQQHIEQRMWAAADAAQLKRLGKQAWVTVPEAPKEPAAAAAAGGLSSMPAPSSSVAPSQAAAAAAAADSKGKQPMAVDGAEPQEDQEQQAQFPAFACNPLAAMHAVLCQTAGRLALFSLLLSDARQLEGGSWKGCLKLSRSGTGASSGLRLAYWQQLPHLSFPELQCLRDGTPYQPAAAAAAGAAAPPPAAAQPQQQEAAGPALELSLQEGGSLAASSSSLLHHPLSGDPVQLRLPLDNPASFDADRLLLQAAAHSAAVQLAGVQAALQQGGRLAPAGVHCELLPIAGAAGDAPSSPLLQLWSGSSLQLSLSVQLRTGRLLLAAGPALLESEQGASAAAALSAAQQQIDQLRQDALTQPLPPGSSRGMLGAQLVAQAVARLSLQLSVRARMDAAATAAVGLGLRRASLPQRLLQQHLREAALLLEPLSGNTLTLALPAAPPPGDLAAWLRKQAQQRPGQGVAAAGSGATRCFMLLDFGETLAAQPKQEPGAANGTDAAGAPQLRVLLAVCACTSRGTATGVLQLAELPPGLMRHMRQAAAAGPLAAVSSESRKRRASDAAADAAAAAAGPEQAGAAAGGELELGLAAAASWCKWQASWATLRAQLQLLPAQHAEEVSLAQPERPSIRLPKLPVLAQLDAWAAAQLAASSGGVNEQRQTQPAAKPAATVRLEDDAAAAEAGQWRVELSSSYFAHLPQLLERQGIALAPPAADAQHVGASGAGLVLRYSLQKGDSMLTGISDLLRIGMLHLCLTRLAGCMAANPLAAGAATPCKAAAGGSGGNGVLNGMAHGTAGQPCGDACGGAARAGLAWPLPGCGSVRLQAAGLTHAVLEVAPPPLSEERLQQGAAPAAPLRVTISWADRLAGSPAAAAEPAQQPQPQAQQQQQQAAAPSSTAGGSSSSGGSSMRHIRCCVASEPPLPELVAAALAQQLEAGRVDLFLDSLSLAAHSAALAAAQLTPAAQRAAGLLPGALRLLPGSSGGGSSALRLRAQLQQGDRAATLALAFHAAGYTLLQLQPSPAGGATASVPAWATQLWQRLEQQMPSFASVEAAAAAPPAQPADQKPPAPALVQVPQLQQAWVHQQDLAQAISAVLQAVGAPPVPT